MGKNSNTPYDDVFRTLLEKVAKLIIPVVNETMGTSYNMDEEVILQLRNEHHTVSGEIIEDSNFIISGNEYHYECQSTADDTIAVRIIEYDLARALEGALEGRDIDGVYHLKFPRSCVLYLRSGKDERDSDSVILDYPDGTSKEIRIPVIHIQKYSLKEIMEKDLVFFIPFYLMRYERGLKSGKKEMVEDTIRKVEEDYQTIRQYLSEYFSENMYGLSLVDELTDKVAGAFLSGKPEIKERIGDIMGGRVLKTKTDEIYNNGLVDGEAKGKAEGKAEGISYTVDIVNSVKKGILTVAEAAKKLGITEEVLKTTFML